MRRAAALGLAAVLAALAVLAAACDGDAEPSGASAAPEASPTSSLYTLSPLPVPEEPPPSGTLIADIEQSSRDGAAGRFQVWVDNDTTTAITPTAVTYTDGRFQEALPGTRLRDIPAQARRGFPVYQPDRPSCDSTATSGTVTVDYLQDGQTKSVTVPVSDEADVVDRITSARCLELAVGRIARLSFADEVTASGDGGKGSVGTMTLVVDTTGRPGSTLVIDTIAGNPVLSPGELGVFTADLTITGDQPPRRVPVPVVPTRCDAHAFGESGSFAAFAFNVRLDGEPGQFVLRLGPTAAANAITYAKASCGFLTSIGGGEG